MKKDNLPRKTIGVNGEEITIYDGYALIKKNGVERLVPTTDRFLKPVEKKQNVVQWMFERGISFEVLGDGKWNKF